jgi:predicted ester cyclase
MLKGDREMSNSTVGDAAIAVVRRNTEEVQGKGNWDLFEELFADDFVDHTPQPGTTPDKAGVRVLYKGLRAAFPDFTPEIHWQVAAGDLVTTYKTYHGTHQGEFLGIPATGKKVSFYTVDAMRVVDRQDHRALGRRDAARPDAAARCRLSAGRSAMTTPIAEQGQSAERG